MQFKTLAEFKGFYNFNKTQLENIAAIELESEKYKKYTGENYSYFALGKTKEKKQIISFFILKSVDPYNDYFDQYVLYLDQPFFSTTQNRLCQFQIKGKSTDLSLELIDITPTTYINLGIGTYGLNNLQEFCALIGYKKIYGEISTVDYKDKNDIGHGDRLYNFYKKNGFLIGKVTSQHGKMLNEIEWSNTSMLIKKNDILDAAALGDDKFFYGVLETCKCSRLKIEIGQLTDENGHLIDEMHPKNEKKAITKIVEKTFNCYNDEGIGDLQNYFNEIIQIYKKR